MKQILTFLFAYFIPAVLLGHLEFDTNVRLKTSFNSNWKFALADKASYASPMYDNSNWHPHSSCFLIT